MTVGAGRRAVAEVPAVPAPRLSASWQRSRSFGAPAEEVAPVFIGAVDDESLFFQCGRRILTGLHETLANEPVSLMLTDHNGHVLTRFCHDHTLAAALDRTYLAPGFAFSEREAGTNGLGLALADRTASLVRGDEHYCLGLREYTCAAVPVLDPVSGALLGSVNLTTWSSRSAGLLLALAQTAAEHTSTMMLSHAGGARPRPTPRGEVFHIPAGPQGSPGEPELSWEWNNTLTTVRTALAEGQSVAVAGEAGAGKATLLAAALRRTQPRARLLSAAAPDPRDVESWLALWTPELSKSHTSVIAADVDTLPSWAASELAELVAARAHGPFTITVSETATLPDVLARLVDTVVELPPLRYRRDDVLPLAHHFNRHTRGREVAFSPEVGRALQRYHWPGNADQLRRVVREAAVRRGTIDIQDVVPEVLCGPTRTLTRIETVERDEIVRCLTMPGTTVTRAAEILGMGRATLYRKITQYGIQLPE